jgi:hypothetical protein
VAVSDGVDWRDPTDPVATAVGGLLAVAMAGLVIWLGLATDAAVTLARAAPGVAVGIALAAGNALVGATDRYRGVWTERPLIRGFVGIGVGVSVAAGLTEVPVATAAGAAAYLPLSLATRAWLYRRG